MTSTLAGRPTPLSRVWSGDRIIADDLQGEDIGDVLELHSEASAWWVLPRPSGDPDRQLSDAAAALDLDHLAVSDLTAEDRRAKFEDLGVARLVLTNVVVLDAERAELATHPVSLVATDRALICLADRRGPDFDPAVLLASRAGLLASGGVGAALHLVLEGVIGTYERVVGWLEDASDDLADALFEGRPLTSNEQLHAFRLRRTLSQLRRLTEPMRSVMSELVDSQDEADTHQVRHWTMLRDRHTRVANAADSLRDTLTSVFDTSLALADERSNASVKKLTGWAAILAVPTLVTGFVGMNVTFPLSQSAAGFWFYLVLMLGASLFLYLLFRRKEWV